MHLSIWAGDSCIKLIEIKKGRVSKGPIGVTGDETGKKGALYKVLVLLVLP